MGIKEKLIIWWQQFVGPQLQPAPVPVRKNTGHQQR
jgi:hypothetical protein